jgi:hypothetical protein
VTDPKKPSGLPLPEAMAGNFQDAARWFSQMWSAGTDASAMRGATGPIPSMMMPTLDPHELEKRIADLRSVEHWLELNLGLLRTTIQGLEMQRATLAAWQGMSAAAAGNAAPGRPEGASAAEALAAFQPAAWWNALQQQFAQMAASAAAKEEAAPPKPAAPAAAPGAAAPKAAPGKPKS